MALVNNLENLIRHTAGTVKSINDVISLTTREEKTHKNSSLMTRVQKNVSDRLDTNPSSLAEKQKAPKPMMESPASRSEPRKMMKNTLV